MHELLLFPNSWPKNLGASYTRADTVPVIYPERATCPASVMLSDLNLYLVNI
jgi:hypothetical protein